MSKPLQRTGHRESRYERPNQKWVCGWAVEGNPCELGPDGKGRCPARRESYCTPRREGDRWFCTRPAVFGGACEHGPRPDGSCCHPEPEHPVCQPVLSIGARRGRWVIGASLFTVAAVIALVAGPWGLWAISPGPLSEPHASIEVAGATANCAACHQAPEDHSAFTGSLAAGFADKKAQNQRCLDCHFEGESHPDAAQPHSASPDRLEQAAESAQPAEGDPPVSARFASLARPSHAKGGEITCATCHREHHGRRNDLKAMSDQKCQVCHDNQFHSFADGHPEFREAPSPDESPGLRFDHRSHEDRHFGKETFDCNRCHQPDESGRTMAVASYEQSCADCHTQSEAGDHHGEQIRQSVQTVFRIPPGLDGPWSPEAQAGDPEFPAGMLLLLAGDRDDRAVRALADLYGEADGFLFDWQPEASEGDSASDQPGSIGPRRALQNAVVRLVRDYRAEDARDRLRSRLGRALGLRSDAAAVKNLAQSLASGSFAIAAYADRWLTDALAFGTPEGGADGGEAGSVAELSEDASGWRLGDGGRSVAYRPVQHRDPVFEPLMNALIAAGLGGGDDPSAGASGSGIWADDLGPERTRLAERAFERFTSTEAPVGALASCLKCHGSGSENPAGSVQWAAAGRDPMSVGFTRFEHGSHLTLLGQEESCARCHQLAEEAGADDAKQPDPHHGFRPHRKAECATCHRPERAAQDCLTCHQYHWNRP